jgi:hypothetical protein
MEDTENKNIKNNSIELTLDKLLLEDLKDKYENLKVTQVDRVLSPEELNSIAGFVSDGGKLEFKLSPELLIKQEDVLTLMNTNLKFAGFLNIKFENNIITCTKKAWNKSKNRKTNNNNQWKVIVPEYKGDLIVEDELIDPFDSYQKFSKANDCITKPKPCKNCNCGRAEKENKENKGEIDPNFKPECGKCYMGDAFRCAGCPFRGKPAFEPDEKIDFKNIVTNTNDLAIEEEQSGINVKDKKIKIDI